MCRNDIGYVPEPNQQKNKNMIISVHFGVDCMTMGRGPYRFHSVIDEQTDEHVATAYTGLCIGLFVTNASRGNKNCHKSGIRIQLMASEFSI